MGVPVAKRRAFFIKSLEPQAYRAVQLLRVPEDLTYEEFIVRVTTRFDSRKTIADYKAQLRSGYVQGEVLRMPTSRTLCALLPSGKREWRAEQGQQVLLGEEGDPYSPRHRRHLFDSERGQLAKNGRYEPETLETVESSVTVANGDKLATLGESIFRVPVLIVRDISHECILGSDFFKEHGCQILYDLGTLHMGNEVLAIFYKNTSPKVCRVFLDQNVEIDGGTEVVISATLERGFDRNNGTPGITESPRGAKVTTPGVALARCLTVPTGGKAVVRLANVSEDRVIIRADKCIADFQPLHHECATVTIFECNGVSVQEPSKPCMRDPTQWREELKADYAGLTDGQRSSFAKLIDEYSDIFAHDSGDLGRTDLAQHEIITG